MKLFNILLVFIFLFFSSVGYAKDKRPVEKPKSKLEQCIDKRTDLCKKDPMRTSQQCKNSKQAFRVLCLMLGNPKKITSRQNRVERTTSPRKMR